MERVLAFEDPFVSPNRLFPCGSGCNQNRYPIPEWVLWGYNSPKKKSIGPLKLLINNDLIEEKKMKETGRNWAREPLL